jgi:hypothetical protein
VLPEDGRLRTKSFNMYYDGGEVGFIREMAQIAAREGAIVIVGTEPNGRKPLQEKLTPEERRYVKIHELDTGTIDAWAEDNGEFNCQGGVCVPPHTAQAMEMVKDIFRDRIHRYYPDVDAEKLKPSDLTPAAVRQKYPRADYALQGAVADRGLSKTKIALALAEDKVVHETRTYFEGGNLLTGQLDDGFGYAIVGRDGLAAARGQLKRDLERDVTEAETIAFLARDLGYKPENIFPVEQPQDFHIDMAMVTINGRNVLLNDARAVARQEAEWLRADLPKNAPATLRAETEETIARLKKDAEKRAFYEDRAAADLKRQGFNVYRVAGVFEEQGSRMNFLNAEQGTGFDGKRFYITLGGTKRAQEQYVTDLGRLGVVDRVYMLDPTLSEGTLKDNGGISCRVKSDGTLGR